MPPVEPPVAERPDVFGQPWLLGVAFVWWFLIAAPAEELLFRGIIQNRLRVAFTVGPAITLAALVFVLPHTLFVLIDGGGHVTVLMQAMQTFAGGLVFAIAYERTDNLLVPSVGHAIMWTMVLFV